MSKYAFESRRYAAFSFPFGFGVFEVLQQPVDLFCNMKQLTKLAISLRVLLW